MWALYKSWTTKVDNFPVCFFSYFPDSSNTSFVTLKDWIDSKVSSDAINGLLTFSILHIFHYRDAKSTEKPPLITARCLFSPPLLLSPPQKHLL